MNPTLPALEAQSPNHWTTREVPSPILEMKLLRPRKGKSLTREPAAAGRCYKGLGPHLPGDRLCPVHHPRDLGRVCPSGHTRSDSPLPAVPPCRESWQEVGGGGRGSADLAGVWAPGSHGPPFGAPPVLPGSEGHVLGGKSCVFSTTVRGQYSHLRKGHPFLVC